MKYPTTYIKCVATLPCEIFAQKSSELPCKTQPFQNSCSKIFPTDVSNILFTDEKIFTVATPNYQQNDRLYCSLHTYSNREERRRDKSPAHTINVQSLMTSVNEPLK